MSFAKVTQVRYLHFFSHILILPTPLPHPSVCTKVVNDVNDAVLVADDAMMILMIMMMMMMMMMALFDGCCNLLQA